MYTIGDEWFASDAPSTLALLAVDPGTTPSLTGGSLIMKSDATSSLPYWVPLVEAGSAAATAPSPGGDLTNTTPNGTVTIGDSVTIETQADGIYGPEEIGVTVSALSSSDGSGFGGGFDPPCTSGNGPDGQCNWTVTTFDTGESIVFDDNARITASGGESGDVELYVGSTMNIGANLGWLATDRDGFESDHYKDNQLDDTSSGLVLDHTVRVTESEWRADLGTIETNDQGELIYIAPDSIEGLTQADTITFEYTVDDDRDDENFDGPYTFGTRNDSSVSNTLTFDLTLGQHTWEPGPAIGEPIPDPSGSPVPGPPPEPKLTATLDPLAADDTFTAKIEVSPGSIADWDELVDPFADADAPLVYYLDELKGIEFEIDGGGTIDGDGNYSTRAADEPREVTIRARIDDTPLEPGMHQGGDRDDASSPYFGEVTFIVPADPDGSPGPSGGPGDGGPDTPDDTDELDPEDDDDDDPDDRVSANPAIGTTHPLAGTDDGIPPFIDHWHLGHRRDNPDDPIYLRYGQTESFWVQDVFDHDTYHDGANDTEHWFWDAVGATWAVDAGQLPSEAPPTDPDNDRDPTHDVWTSYIAPDADSGVSEATLTATVDDDGTPGGSWHTWDVPLDVQGSNNDDPLDVEANLRFYDIDLDIDSDNNNGLTGTPDRSPEEDDLEHQTDGAKVVLVNTDDTDADGVPDFADGFGMFSTPAGYTTDPYLTTDGERFTPVVLNLQGRVPGDTKVTFLYDASDPAAMARTEQTVTGPDGTEQTVYDYHLPTYDPTPDAPGETADRDAVGHLRLWLKDGDQMRTVDDFVKANHEYTLDDLGLDKHGSTLTLYLESVGHDNYWWHYGHDLISVGIASDTANGINASDTVRIDTAEVRMNRDGFGVSNPAPVFSSVNVTQTGGTSATVTPEGDAVRTNVTISGTLTDAASDLIQGSDGTIGSVEVYINGDATPAATISVSTTQKLDADPANIFATYDFTGSFNTSLNLDLHPGVNTLRLVAVNPYGFAGFHESIIDVDATPPDTQYTEFELALDDPNESYDGDETLVVTYTVNGGDPTTVDFGRSDPGGGSGDPTATATFTSASPVLGGSITLEEWEDIQASNADTTAATFDLDALNLDDEFMLLDADPTLPDTWLTDHLLDVTDETDLTEYTIDPLVDIDFVGASDAGTLHFNYFELIGSQHVKNVLTGLEIATQGGDGFTEYRFVTIDDPTHVGHGHTYLTRDGNLARFVALQPTETPDETPERTTLESTGDFAYGFYEGMFDGGVAWVEGLKEIKAVVDDVVAGALAYYIPTGIYYIWGDEAGQRAEEDRHRALLRLGNRITGVEDGLTDAWEVLGPILEEALTSEDTQAFLDSVVRGDYITAAGIGGARVRDALKIASHALNLLGDELSEMTPREAGWVTGRIVSEAVILAGEAALGVGVYKAFSTTRASLVASRALHAAQQADLSPAAVAAVTRIANKVDNLADKLRAISARIPERYRDGFEDFAKKVISASEDETDELWEATKRYLASSTKHDGDDLNLPWLVEAAMEEQYELARRADGTVDSDKIESVRQLRQILANRKDGDGSYPSKLQTHHVIVKADGGDWLDILKVRPDRVDDMPGLELRGAAHRRYTDVDPAGKSFHEIFKDKIDEVNADDNFDRFDDAEEWAREIHRRAYEDWSDAQGWGKQYGQDIWEAAKDWLNNPENVLPAGSQ
ncbi:MAG: hypothetical protein AAFY08_01630 [Planctomycetota bacterium]